MNCSKRVFVCKEKYNVRYVHATNRELTARAIVKQRLDDGYWYDEKLSEKLKHKLHTLSEKDEPFAKWLLSRKSEYEVVEEIYLEEII